MSRWATLGLLVVDAFQLDLTKPGTFFVSLRGIWQRALGIQRQSTEQQISQWLSRDERLSNKCHYDYG